MPKQPRLYLKDIEDKLNNPYITYYSNFFDEKEQALLLPSLKKSKREFRFDGGYPEAQRKILVIPAKYESEYLSPPIVALLFEKPCELTHRNVLGTILSLGVNRNTIGDIAIFEDKIQIIVQEHLAEFFINNLKFINNHPIEPILLNYNEIIPYNLEFELETTTASSNRLDAIIASIFKTSRKKAVELIRSGLVLHNHLPLKKIIIPASIGDTISVKGKGKVKITGFGSKTKKGRIRINFNRYK